MYVFNTKVDSSGKNYSVYRNLLVRKEIVSISVLHWIMYHSALIKTRALYVLPPDRSVQLNPSWFLGEPPGHSAINARGLTINTEV